MLTQAAGCSDTPPPGKQPTPVLTKVARVASRSGTGQANCHERSSRSSSARQTKKDKRACPEVCPGDKQAIDKLLKSSGSKRLRFVPLGGARIRPLRPENRQTGKESQTINFHRVWLSETQNNRVLEKCEGYTCLRCSDAMQTPAERSVTVRSARSSFLHQCKTRRKHIVPPNRKVDGT